MTGQHFGVSREYPGRFDVTKLAPVLEAIHERLARVSIECLPWQDFITRYDAAGTLFYLDPPYFGNEDDYGAGMFAPADFAEMAERLARISGRFILSLNDRPEVREIFGAFAFQEEELAYTIGHKNNTHRARELIITSP